MMDVKEWTKSNQKFSLFKDYLFNGGNVSWNMEFWFYWVAYFMESKFSAIVEQLDNVKTADVRYLDQIQQMKQYVQEVLKKCRSILIKQKFFSSFYEYHDSFYKFPCKCYHDRFVCYVRHYKSEKIYNCRMCPRAKDAIMEDVYEIIRGFLVLWLSDFYYVWKLYKSKRIKFGVYVSDDNVKLMPIDNIKLWEVVCEDDEKQILCHPLLPHPLDFLEKREIIGSLYADKARFEYQIPGLLSKYPVILSSKNQSDIPKLAFNVHQEEKAIVEWKQPQSQVLYQETTIRNHNCKKPSRKRRLSKILKEGRKKKKTRWLLHRQRKNQLRQFFRVDDGDDYYGVYDDYEYYFTNYDDYSCGYSSGYNRYDYDEYDEFRYDD